MKIIKTDITHIQLIAPLFDAYRVFYKQTSDIEAATEFLINRFSNNESTIFLALDGELPIGFVQLYTTFSSVSLEPVFILNDLYVNEKFRGQKVGESLLIRAKEYCDEKNYKGLALETAIDNPAQKLYEKLDWKKDTDCFHYFWTAK